MSEFDVDTHGLDEVVARMNGAPQLLAQRMITTMRASLAVLEEAVAVNTPVGATGNLRGGIAGDIYGQPLRGEFLGKLTTATIYGYAVELGQPAGKRPPASELEYWVIRKLGVSPEQATGVAFAIAEKIYRVGTKGQFMFKRGFEMRRSAAVSLWEQMLGAFAVEVF